MDGAWLSSRLERVSRNYYVARSSGFCAAMKDETFLILGSPPSTQFAPLIGTVPPAAVPELMLNTATAGGVLAVSYLLIARFLRGNTAILPSGLQSAAPVRHRNNDVEYFYRPDSDFFYLTGFAEPEAVAVYERFEVRNRHQRMKEGREGRMAGLAGPLVAAHMAVEPDVEPVRRILGDDAGQ